MTTEDLKKRTKGGLDFVTASLVYKADNRDELEDALKDLKLFDAYLLHTDMARYSDRVIAERHKADKPVQSVKRFQLLSVDDVEEREADWLIQDYMAKGQINIIAGDGGAGKTSMWCYEASAISKGLQPKMMNDNPFLEPEENKTVLLFSAEECVSHVLKKRLRVNGADMSNIYFMDVSDDNFPEIKFNSDTLKSILEEYRPALCIFDPIQAFVPAEIHMGERNAMRQCLQPLIGFGRKYGTTFLIVVHTNKRSGVYGRNRIADSADVWDSARTVCICGETQEKGIRYMSVEKSNYGMPPETLLFSIDDGVIISRGKTSLKDKDYVSGSSEKGSPATDEAVEYIIDALQDGEMLTGELDKGASASGISKYALRSAKDQLNKEGKIKVWAVSEGKGKGTKWHIKLMDEAI